MEEKAFEVIFNDEYLTVVNKIVKILICPSPKKEKVTFTTLLEEYLKTKIYPCHRLDRETTGLIMYAKAKEIHREIFREFQKKEIKKKYIGFVKGRLNKKKGILRSVVLDREGSRFGEKPKKAETLYKVLKEFEHFSIVEMIPLTGRTNQLRIQFSQISHPILGERKYAKGKDFKVKFKRVALHAYFLSFIHPISKEKIDIKIDLPEDMKTFLDKYKNY
jgi:23S rRNA pseudouridine1911/1915/1917 synthase